ncbi:MAG TPA: hemerythrin domain-containing protein [Amnibacterium sp.]|nr:hemerythrin domain-containing protein [Amnibacterium sp.]
MDITQVILDDHAEQRRLFAALEDIGPQHPDALAAVWKRLRALLDTHAEAEERLFYPALVALGKRTRDDEEDEETEDAIHDHNEIRDAASAVEHEVVGSEAWFGALAEADEVNGDHMAEEEREGLTDFRRKVSLEERHDLAVRFLAFESSHMLGVKPVDKDPKEYVRENG